MEWPLQFLPGHWALSLQKLPLMRFKDCAWIAEPTLPMQIAFPWGKADSTYQGEMAAGQKGEGGWPKARRMRGMATVKLSLYPIRRDGPMWPPVLGP